MSRGAAAALVLAFALLSISGCASSRSGVTCPSPKLHPPAKWLISRL